MHSTSLTLNRRQALKLFGSSLAFLGLAACTTDAGDDITGIIGAMEVEVATIKASMSNVTTTTIAGMDFLEGTIADHHVVVVQCGMGKVNAGICAQTLITEYDATRIINTGVAGNLTDQLTINDFVVSVDSVQHDYDVSPIGFEKGEIPYTEMIAFPADEHLRELALEAVKKAAPNSKVLEGRICSGDQFIATEAQVTKITSEFGGLCCEMEGGAVAQVCYLNNIPYVIIRAISDDSDGTLIEDFETKAAEECAAAVLAMIEEL